MAFRFSLAGVLRLREIVEQREERTLQTITTEIVRSAQLVERLDSELRAALVAREQQLRQPIAAAYLQSFETTLEQMKKRRQQEMQRLAKLRDLHEQQMRVYQRAHRNSETLVDMRQEQKVAYDAEAAKREQAMLDDRFIALRNRH